MASRAFFSLLSLYCLIASSSSKPDKKLFESVSFTYGGSHGPTNWGNLSPAFSVCSHGKSQSPIDIVKSKAVYSKSLKPIYRNYCSANATLIDNGFNIGVHFEEYAGCAVIDGKNYSLKQIHWHSPSEHRINGQQFAAELHLVHRTNDEGCTVLAVLYELGHPDPFVSKLQEKFGEMGKEVFGGDEEDVHISLGTLDTKYLRRKTRKYFRYAGSLTTPPCSEHVLWHILGKVKTISKEQVEMIKWPLRAAYKNNSRPTQPLNGRQVELYDELSHP